MLTMRDAKAASLAHLAVRVDANDPTRGSSYCLLTGELSDEGIVELRGSNTKKTAPQFCCHLDACKSHQHSTGAEKSVSQSPVEITGHGHRDMTV
ncbi:hypothetical protein ElyMa_001673100 [Elysia marginata]|uniref:Uncharacterized protein n=1 Tax=Elysia marginata TaxID=1093978 RepID=A0AAV4JQ87_9GAST|nr:hypothetical protein ElyMa_001673100 [Elysia marginata]